MAIVFDSDAGTITGLSVGGLPDGTVDAGTLASNAVTAAKLATDSVTAVKIAANSVDSAELIDGAVDDSHIAALASSKLTGALPAISAANLTAIPAANITGTLPAISGANLINTSAAQLTGTLPAIDGSALTNLVQQDPTVLPYVNLDVTGHTNVGNFTIDSRGRYRIFLDLRVGYSNNAGFTKVYLGTSSGGGLVGNARLMIENVGNSSNGTANIGLNFQWVMDFGTSLSYPYTVYANVYNSGTGSSSIFNQSDNNGYPVVSCLKVKDIATATGMVAFGS